MLYFRFGFVITFAVAAAFAAYGVACAPSRVAERYGTRGMRREQALAKGGPYRVFEPVIRWIGARLSGLLGPGAVTALETQLRMAGDPGGLTAEEYVGLMLLGGFGGVVLGCAASASKGTSSLVVLVLFTSGLGAFLPSVLIGGAAQRRMQEIRRGLPGAIDLMTLSMSAGLDFPGAVRQVVEKASSADAPIIEEFRHILSGLRVGRTRKQVLVELAHRAPVEAVRDFVAAVVQAEERGNPVAPVLQMQSELLRRGRTASAEQSASKAGVSMTLPVLLLFFSVLILIVAPLVLTLKSVGRG